VTEAEARAALRAFVAVGEIEPWIAEQRWEATTRGWRVRGRLRNRRFRVKPVPGGVRVSMSAPGRTPAEWFVPG
jgi:hypothetical protein